MRAMYDGDDDDDDDDAKLRPKNGDMVEIVDDVMEVI